MGWGHRDAHGGGGVQACVDRSPLASDAGTAEAGLWPGPGAVLGADPAVNHGRMGRGPSKSSCVLPASLQEPSSLPSWALCTVLAPPAQRSVMVAPPCPLPVSSLPPPRPCQGPSPSSAKLRSQPRASFQTLSGPRPWEPLREVGGRLRREGRGLSMDPRPRAPAPAATGPRKPH